MKLQPALLLLCALSACAPKLNWREVRPEGAGVLALFPCKPEIASRPMRTEGGTGGQAPSRMGLAACKAGETSFSLSWAELTDPAELAPALQQMRESLAAKLGAQPSPAQPFVVPGMTPSPAALQQELAAGPQQARVAVFSRGLRVYQAVMLGPVVDAAAWETFTAALKLDT